MAGAALSAVSRGRDNHPIDGCLAFLMQHTGVLRNWHDDRGFGFIAPTQGGGEIFVHIGAFPRDGSRPVVGERLGYALAPGRDGKPQAVNVTRLAVGKTRPMRAPMPARERTPFPVLGTLAVVVVLGVFGAWGYRYVTNAMQRQALAAQPVNAVAEPSIRAVDPTPRLAAPAALPTTATFTCDGRTHCSQMSSCAEATWFIKHCPGTEMDSDGDGIPCEQQFCNGVAGR